MTNTIQFDMNPISKKVIDELKTEGYKGVERKSGYFPFDALLESLGDYPFFTKKQGDIIEVYAGTVNIYLGFAV
jgi:uncharacterized protein (UPF0297 family)